MSNNKSKDDLLHERIAKDLGIDNDSATDLVNLIHIILKKNDKNELYGDLKDIYEENNNLDEFVDWVWNLYHEEEAQTGFDEERSEESDRNRKVNTGSNQPSNAQKSLDNNNIKKSDSNLGKRSRPAIYDEFETKERMEKVENIRNKNENAKKLEKSKQDSDQKQKRFQNQTQGYNQPPTQNRHAAPPLNIHKPQPPAPSAPKEEKKLSILDRIKKRDDVESENQPKKSFKTAREVNQEKGGKNLVLTTSKHETITKKFKTNPEDSQPAKPPQRFATKDQVKAKEYPPAQPQSDMPQQSKKFGANKPQTQPTKQATNMQEEPQKISAQTQGQAEGEPTQGKLKVRCRNWPNCKTPDCKFHHPTENCTNFPACAYGDKCLYIHPAIPCKFGAFCQRPNCTYTHPRASMNSYYGGGYQGKKPFRGGFGGAPKVNFGQHGAEAGGNDAANGEQ